MGAQLSKTALTTLTTLLITIPDISATALVSSQFIIGEQNNEVQYVKQPNSSTEPLIEESVASMFTSATHSNSNILDTQNIFNKTERELLSYLQLKDDWDYEGGVVPENYSVNTSINFLKMLKKFQLPLPKPMLTGDGEVCLYWKKKKFYIEVGFEKEGQFSYLVDDYISPFGKDDCNIDDFVKTKLYASLNSFAPLS